MVGGGNFGDSVIGSIMGLELSNSKEQNRKDEREIRSLRSRLKKQMEENQRLDKALQQKTQQFQNGIAGQKNTIASMQKTIVGLQDQVASLKKTNSQKERSQIALHVRMTMHRENLANEMALKASAVRLVSSKTGVEPGVVEDWIKAISEPDQTQRIIDRFEEEDRRIHPYIPTSVKRRGMMDNHENWAGGDFYEWAKDVAPDYFERRAAKRKTKEQG